MAYRQLGLGQPLVHHLLVLLNVLHFFAGLLVIESDHAGDIAGNKANGLRPTTLCGEQRSQAGPRTGCHRTAF
jgi:hypothetical protein